MAWAWCTTGEMWGGRYHLGNKEGYTFETKCGEPIDLLDLKYRALKDDEIERCEGCSRQVLLEELAE